MPGVPDGWTFSVAAGLGVAAQIVIPAGGPGVSRVLTSILAGFFTTASIQSGFNLVVLDGATNIFQWAIAVNNTAPASADGDKAFDLRLVGSPATAMTIQCGALAGVNEQLLVKGYDL